MIDPDKMEGLALAKEEQERFETLKNNLGSDPSLETLTSALDKWTTSFSYRWFTAVEMRFLFQYLIPLYTSKVEELQLEAGWAIEYAREFSNDL